MLITHGVNGLLVKTEDDWLNALETLVRDPDLRRRLGEEVAQERGRELFDEGNRRRLS